jgi:putative methyltransferase (TIGR04325 family)
VNAPQYHSVSHKFRRIANELAELPGLRQLARPMYARMFERAAEGNSYCGAYDSYAEALRHAPVTLPSTYDVEDAARMYRDQHQRIRACDYPLVYWLGRLLASGQRRVFDLGGHIGVSYYGFGHYLDFPDDLHWQVHDTPATVAAGRAWAREHDPRGRLTFADSPDAAAGQDVLVASGVLQYLDYTLPQLLERLASPPPHVLVNLTPMHPSRSYFTLQHIGIAICPYRVMAVPDFLTEMQSLGYTAVEHWEAFERKIRVPFEPQCSIDCYRGFYFRRER